MENMGTLSSQLSMAKVGTPFSQLGYELSISSSERIESKLSYSYIELIIDVDEPFKRTFYEIECIKGTDRKSTRLNSSHVAISYAVFCLKKKNHKHYSMCESA